MRTQGTPVDPDAISDRVREVMSRQEFRYEKSWLDRAREWIGEQIEQLLGRFNVDVPAGTFSGGAGSFVAWLLIILALIAVIATIVYVLRHRIRRQPREDEPALASEVEQRYPASHWAREAEAHEAAGEWKLALRARYRELVRSLVDQGRLPDVPGLTTGELRRELHASSPAAGPPFDRATSLFELAWYAGAATAEEENTELRASAAQVLDLVAERPGHRVGSVP